MFRHRIIKVLRKIRKHKHHVFRKQKRIDALVGAVTAGLCEFSHFTKKGASFLDKAWNVRVGVELTPRGAEVLKGL